MNRKVWISLIILFFLVVSVSLFFIINPFEKEEQEFLGFTIEGLKNAEYNLNCRFTLKGGVFEGDDYFSFCSGCIDYCPKVPFKFFIYDELISFFDFNNDGKKEAIIFLGREVGDSDRENFLIITSEGGNSTYPFKIEEKIDSIFIDNKIIIISSNGEEKKYRIVGNQIEEIKNLNWNILRSVSFGFEIKYPDSWKVEKIKDNSFKIYNPLIKDYPFPFSIIISKEEPYSNFQIKKGDNIYAISFDEKSPYGDIFKEMMRSFRINEKFNFEDFTYFKEEIFQSETFLEIDTDEMKIYLYRDGKKYKDFNILTKGDYENWGGAAAGLYSAISKQKTAFSNISLVYMPYAIRFYGSYFLHGEPYYSSGVKITTPFSGGCFRVKNEDMKIIFEEVEEGMPILVIDKKNDDYLYEDKELIPFPEISAENYLIADLDSGFIISERNIKKQHSIASITKLMTALVIVENTNIKKTMTVRPYMLNGPGNTPLIFSGRTFYLADLFRPLLIESSNNAAWVLTHYFGRERTLEIMNEKTNKIMMDNTIFTDPTGFDEGNISTAEDLFYLARYIKNTAQPLLNISKGENVPLVNSYVFPNLQNLNVFYENPYFLGGKSGFLLKSNYTGLYIFNIKERNIVFIILGANDQQALKEEIEESINWIKNLIE